MKILSKLAVLVSLAISLLSSSVFAEEIINGAGATFPYPLYSSWAYEYAKTGGGKLNYQSIGSGGGVRQIIARTVDFGASDDAMKPEELEKNKLLQWPQVIGGIVLAVNVNGVKSGEMVLDSNTVCGIFLGKIKKWDDEKIKSLNPKLKLPSENIAVVHRADGSGTTAVFTHYLSGACSEWKEKVGNGKSVKWPVGIGAKGNEGVSNYVKGGKNTIGYVEYAYALQNKLNYILLKNSSGSIVKPTEESFASAAESVELDPAKHFYSWITNAKGKNAWPISAYTYIIVAKEKTDSNKKTIKFFDWAFSEKGNDIAGKLDYVALPNKVKEKIRAYWKSNGIK